MFRYDCDESFTKKGVNRMVVQLGKALLHKVVQRNYRRT